MAFQRNRDLVLLLTPISKGLCLVIFHRLYFQTYILDIRFSCATDVRYSYTAVESSCCSLHYIFCDSKTKKNVILLTNTTLTVLRQCGKYLQMSRLLRSISSDVLLCLKQLFQYYLYAVCSFFTIDLPVRRCL